MSYDPMPLVHAIRRQLNDERETRARRLSRPNQGSMGDPFQTQEVHETTSQDAVQPLQSIVKLQDGRMPQDHSREE